MGVIHVKFRDRPEVQTSRFSKITTHLDSISLIGVATYVDHNTPHIEDTGCDFDGDILFNQFGFGKIYFSACDRIVIEEDGKSVVIFDREDPITSNRISSVIRKFCIAFNEET